MDSSFVKYWSKLNQKHSTQLLYDLHDNTFYFLRSRLADGSVILSPLDTPTEKLNVQSDYLVDMNMYLTEHFGNTSESSQQNFGVNSGTFRNDFGKFSEAFRDNSGAVRNDFGSTSSITRSENDALLTKIRTISAKVQKATKSKKAKSSVKANQFERQAEQWHMQDDTEELQNVLARLKGLHGSLTNLKTNVVKGKKNAKNKRFRRRLLTFSLVLFFSSLLAIPVRFILLPYFRTPARIIARYEQRSGTTLSNWRRGKVLQAAEIQQHRSVTLIIDSINEVHPLNIKKL